MLSEGQKSVFGYLQVTPEACTLQGHDEAQLHAPLIVLFYPRLLAALRLNICFVSSNETKPRRTGGLFLVFSLFFEKYAHVWYTYDT